MSVRLNNFMLAIGLLICFGCSSDDVDPLESINSVRISFINIDDPSDIAISGYSNANNGNSLEAPVLNSNTTYEVYVEVSDGSINLTSEILTQGTQYRVFINTSTGTFVATDEDDNGYPIGLRGTFTTGSFRTAAFEFTLFSKFDKEAATASPGRPAAVFGTIVLQFSSTMIVLP